MLPTVSPSLGGVPYPYDIRFADCENSPATRTYIEEYLERMAHFYDRITYGRVTVRIPHKHGGVRFFHIHVQLDVPGRRLAVSREPEANEKHTDIRLAIRDAFHKMTRQLEDFVKTRNESKRKGVA
ncbi:MAG: ribosome-associated translation inhibitor RaiA [Bdellovibrionales bacterium]|nr:ribosome-associated translation inhibitor RaiA [Bdellovibrionales bacterium]